MTDLVGWAAAALFPMSYLCKRPLALVSVQATAALLWLAYGLLSHSAPVIGANIVVASAASIKAFRLSRGR